jgi:low temperature requirement protein LtrA
MLGFAVPGLGRSSTTEWTIEGGHLAERNQLFVMIALGESILATGASISGAARFDTPTLLAMLAAFAGSVALWWIYFDTAGRDGTHAIEHAADPGKIGARFHYVHVVLIAGVIVSAVGDELVLHHPGEHVDAAAAAVLVGGPLLYLAGNAAYKRIVYGGLPLSHLVGAALLIVLWTIASLTDRLMVEGLTTLLLIGVAVQQSLFRRRLPAPQPRG